MYALDTLTVTGPVNGIQLDDVCQRVVRTDTPNTFASLTVNGNVTLHRATNPLSWTLNGLDLSRLDRLVWLRDADQTLAGHIFLQQPLFASVEVQTLLAGVPPAPVDLLTYLRHHWNLRRPQTVTGDVRFGGGLTVDHLTANQLTVTGRVNGKDLSALMASALTVAGGTVTGHWTLPDLIVNGPLMFTSLNGIPADALVKDSATELRFSSHQTVYWLTVSGDLSLPDGGQVFNLDPSKHLHISNFLQRHGTFTVSSDVTFGALTFTRPLIVNGTVGGVPLHQSSVLTLSSDQTVRGHTWLRLAGGQCLVSPNLDTPSLNGVDLRRLLGSAVRLNGSYNVTAYWTFTNMPFFIDYNVTNSAAEQQLYELLQLLLNAQDQLQLVDEAVARQYVATVQYIYQALLDARARLQAASYLQYYVQTQSWRSDVIRFAPVYLDGEGQPPTLLLAIWDTRIRLLRWAASAGGVFGQWTDGPAYPEARLAWMAGLMRAAGTRHAAVARMAAPPASAAVPDQVYRWDDPVLEQLHGAVNYIFLYHRNVLVQSQAMPSHKTVDVKSLQPSSSHDCFLFVHFLGNVSHLACYRDAQTKFTLHQAIDTHGGRQASVYSAAGEACVAVANSGAGGRVDLWCWAAAATRLTLRQTIASAAADVSTAVLDDHLVMAVVREATHKYDGIVNTYRFEPIIGKWAHAQTVPAFNLAGLATQLAVAGRSRPDMFALHTHYPAAVYAGKFMGHEW
ncbi:uncharacterized protein LOC119102019 [Pollicipes pollicipes]|uniref:uncharacterized protein LOC119102019 n=1 Tax=Pollicipes pollicipes TaxID=41117 RepID=UPI0018850615|nr:uncharacterized protein LOC119102019 [Pollicipes pollicipes]